MSKMHDHEQEITDSLVQHLLDGQFPQWAHLPRKRVQSAGTDNAIYRLGEDMAVRLPRVDWAVAQIDLEFAWLPHLAPHVPLALPTPIAKGEPSAGYPWAWGVYSWLAGENATLDRLTNPTQAARDLAHFVRAMQAIPTQPSRISSRGKPLPTREANTRAALEASRGLVDVAALTEVWEAALNGPAWDGQAVWAHGDLQAGNLLARNGRLSGVIDFGCAGVADPALDLLPAWDLFTPEMRAVFRAEVGVDDATWERGRGWALSVAIIQLPYYQHSNPTLANIARYTLQQVLLD